MDYLEKLALDLDLDLELEQDEEKAKERVELAAKIFRRYAFKSILDLEVLGLKYTSKANQVFELGVAMHELGAHEHKDLEFAKTVTLREWIFGMLCACAGLAEYEEEIDSLFVKRMSEIDKDLIYKHKNWDIYVQTGQHITAAVKLSAVIQHDLESNIGDDITPILLYQVALGIGKTLDLTMFPKKCKKDVVELFRKMNKDFSERATESQSACTQALAMSTLNDLVKDKISPVIPDLYTNVFFFGLSDLLKEMSADLINIDSKEFKTAIDKFFKEEDFCENLDSQGFDIFKYMTSSENYAKRVIKKGLLEEYGTHGIDAFFAGASLNAYFPLRTSRSDYQFILYFLVNQALNAYNKVPKSHLDSGNFDRAKENMLKSYLLGKRFNIEGKELHDFAITLNIIFSLVDEMNNMVKLHLSEVVDEVVILKTTHSKLSNLLTESYNEIDKLQEDRENEIISRDSELSQEKNKLYKEIYKNLRQDMNDELENYKKENENLKKSISLLAITKDDEVYDKEITIKETPGVKYISDFNILIIGDYNLRTNLLENVFSSVKKIDGNNSANLNPDSVLAGVDIIVYQYTFCQHESMKFVREGAKRNIPIVYFKSVNEKKILDEIYGNFYR